MNKIYANRDFYLSAFIIARGCPLTGHSRVNQTTLFEFEETAELRKLVEQYYSMTALIEPMAYGAAIRSLKSVIHAANTNSKEHLYNGNNFNSR
jgi:hypothetical protein